MGCVIFLPYVKNCVYSGAAAVVVVVVVEVVVVVAFGNIPVSFSAWNRRPCVVSVLWCWCCCSSIGGPYKCILGIEHFSAVTHSLSLPFTFAINVASLLFHSGHQHTLAHDFSIVNANRRIFSVSHRHRLFLYFRSASIYFIRFYFYLCCVVFSHMLMLIAHKKRRVLFFGGSGSLRIFDYSTVRLCGCIVPRTAQKTVYEKLKAEDETKAMARQHI